MPGLAQILRRTLATSSAVHPQLHPLVSPPPLPVRCWRRLGKVVGPRAHFSKIILNPSNHNYKNNKRKSDLYILFPRTYCGQEEERENNNKIMIRVSGNSVVGVGKASMGGGDENPVRNGDVVDSTGDSPKFLTLPTLLTFARLACIPLFIATFYVNSRFGTTATTSIFVAAAFTDWLDGYLARKMHLGTVFGAFLDPVVDKLMVAATLVLLCSRPPETALLGDVQWLFPVPAIAIIGREITMSAVREWAASQNTQLLQAVAVNNLGKWKTATQMIALTILVVSRDSSLAGSGALAASGVALLYISAGLAVWSLVVYTRKIWKVLLR